MQFNRHFSRMISFLIWYSSNLLSMVLVALRSGSGSENWFGGFKFLKLMVFVFLSIRAKGWSHAHFIGDGGKDMNSSTHINWPIWSLAFDNDDTHDRNSSKCHEAYYCDLSISCLFFCATLLFSIRKGQHHNMHSLSRKWSHHDPSTLIHQAFLPHQH